VSTTVKRTNPTVIARKAEMAAHFEKQRQIFCWDVDGVLIRYDRFNPENDWRRKLVDSDLLEVWNDFQQSLLWNKCLCDHRVDTVEQLKIFLFERNLDIHKAKVIVDTWLTGNIKVNPAALDLLRDLHNQGYQCVIASNQDGLRARWIESWLDEMGLQKVQRFFSCYIGAAKPDKRFYLKIQKILRRDPDDFYLFDDMEEDIEAALSEGWRGQLVRPGFSPVLPEN